jgi:hypothetical protein
MNEKIELTYCYYLRNISKVLQFGHWQNRRGNFIQQHLPSDTFDLSWISIFGNDRVRVHCIYSDDVSFKQNKSKTKYKTKRNKNK